MNNFECPVEFDLHCCLYHFRSEPWNLLTCSLFRGYLTDTLDLNKLEAGKVSLVHTDFDLCDLLANTMRQFLQQAIEKGLEFSVKVRASWLVSQ